MASITHDSMIKHLARERVFHLLYVVEPDDLIGRPDSTDDDLQLEIDYMSFQYLTHMLDIIVKRLPKL